MQALVLQSFVAVGLRYGFGSFSLKSSDEWEIVFRKWYDHVRRNWFCVFAIEMCVISKWLKLAE